MQENFKQIGKRLKEIREIKGISLEKLASELKITSQQYQKYENGEQDIPVGFLYEAANFFEMEMTALITGEEPKLKVYSIVRNGKGLTVNRRKEYNYQDVAYNFIGKKAETFLVTVDPEKEVESRNFYSHVGQEFNYVLEGSIKVTIDGHEIVLNEGDSLYFNSGYQHGMSALNMKKARFLAVVL